MRHTRRLTILAILAVLSCADNSSSRKTASTANPCGDVYEWLSPAIVLEDGPIPIGLYSHDLSPYLPEGTKSVTILYWSDQNRQYQFMTPYFTAEPFTQGIGEGNLITLPVLTPPVLDVWVGGGQPSRTRFELVGYLTSAS